MFLAHIVFSTAFADVSSYYGHLSNDSETLKHDLYIVLSSAHTPQLKDDDVLSPKCSSQTCFKFSPLSYDGARKYLFGQFFLEGENPDYFLIESYCQQKITNDDIDKKKPIGPMLIPDTKSLNTEHVWPQSKFSKQFSTGDQKPNLHILLPVISRVNSTRGNHPMGNVVKTTSAPCANAHLGKNASGEVVFEPSDEVKGDVARALFYFSVRFQLPMGKNEEADMREWHKNDPPDDLEVWRNDAIFDIQKDRNPFIDFPDLVIDIDDF